MKYTVSINVVSAGSGRWTATGKVEGFADEYRTSEGKEVTSLYSQARSPQDAVSRVLVEAAEEIEAYQAELKRKGFQFNG